MCYHNDVIRDYYRILINLVVNKNPDSVELIRRDEKMEDILMEVLKDRVDERVNSAETAKEKETTASHLRDVMESFGVPLDKAMDSLKIPPSPRATYAELVRNRG